LLWEETTRLVHQELELAKAELTQKGKQAGAEAGLFGAAGAIGLLAAAALTTCFILPSTRSCRPGWPRLSLWIRAKTIDQEQRGNAERRAIFVGLWPPMLWLIGNAPQQHE
jgi:hypothetical protein